MIDAEDREYIARGALLIAGVAGSILGGAVVLGLAIGIVRMLGGF